VEITLGFQLGRFSIIKNF